MFKIFRDGFTVRVLEEHGNRPMVPKLPLSSTDVVLDLGAHIGAFTFYAATRAAKVVAVEPMEENWGMWERNCGRFHNCSLIQAAAVEDSYAKDTILMNLGGTVSTYLASRIVKGRCTGRQRDVPVIRMTELMPNVTKVKVDIEGGEYYLDLLKHLANVTGLAVDFHNDASLPKHWKVVADELCTGIESLGFRPIGRRPDFMTGFRSNGIWVR